MSRRLPIVLSWIAVLLAVAELAASIAMVGLSGGDATLAAVGAPVSLTFVVVGALLARRRSSNPVGWLLAGWGLIWSVEIFAQSYANSAVSDARPGAGWVAWFGTVIWHPSFALLAFLLLTFPHGRLLSPRWRLLAWLTVGVYGLLAVAAALSPLAVHTYYPHAAIVVRTPLSGVADATFNVLLGSQLLLLLAALVSLVIRLVRARGEERQQIKWFVYSVVVTVLVFIGGIGVLGDGRLIPVFAAIPVATAVAVLRYRLYAIDRILSRTVSYAALTGVLVAVYVGLVTLLGQLVGHSSLAVATATLAVAALFRPLRQRVQTGVDRRFNRDRYDRSEVVDAFSRRLRQEVNLDALSTDLVAVVRQTVQPVDVGIWLLPADVLSGYQTAEAAAAN
ncbi:MAG: hypothetical protein M3042_02010 [Actinomycetota bacterium]|nr:hypothetical protein [Actinomycetota bacterium]